jgi:UDP-N-acetylmuramoylalanine--D-glutamate ligase
MLAWKDRKVLVLGLGETGLSMTRWLDRNGARVAAADTRLNPPHGRTLATQSPHVPVSTGPFRETDFADADAIAISPGIDRRQPIIAAAIRRGIPVVGDVEIFAQALSAESARRQLTRPHVIAITGSNGKSTVTSMTGEVLKASGLDVVVAGNIGLPVLDAMSEIGDATPLPHVFVLELSSFQLESTASLNADAATVLNITEDHLDRYDGIDEYAAAKARVFEGDGVQVLNRNDLRTMRMVRSGRECVTFGLDAPRNAKDWGLSREMALARGDSMLLPLEEMHVAGLHNAANALAALALGNAIGTSVPPMLDGLRRFQALPHRLAEVAQVGGVTFYDDSKGTNVGATVAALSGLKVPVVLIAGGDGKGQDFSPLAAPVRSRVRAVVLIGRDAPQIERAVGGFGVVVKHAKSMDEAVQMAYAESHEGDAVLLSPACASYDMFNSYVHRGQVFVAAVHALAAPGGERQP